jgi:hypothetical protein
VSSDPSPRPGSGLDAPARPAGADGPGGSARGPGRAEPSLARVLATTVHLWLRRRVLRVTDGARVGALRWIAVSAVVAIVIGGAGGAAVALHHPPASPHRPRHHAPPPVTPVQAATSVNEQAAAAWIQAQVAPGTLVTCDPAMCADLQTAGFPIAQLAALARGGTVTGSTGLVVQTLAANADLGGQLPATAPQVLASFGTGPATVQVRVIGSTAAAFRPAALAAIGRDAKNGRYLASNRRLHLSAVARRQLVRGRVDPRLVHVLARLLAVRALRGVHVTAFGSADPGVAWPAELRSATIAGLTRGAGRHRAGDLALVLRLLRSQPARYRASVQEQAGRRGQITVLIGFPAPGPL